MIRGYLSEHEVNIIINYIRTVLVTRDIPDDFEMNKRLTDVNAEEGKALFRKKGCLGCHQIGKDGGAVGPNLSSVGSRLNPGYLYMHQKDPQKTRFPAQWSRTII